jgi:hypothetical protein
MAVEPAIVLSESSKALHVVQTMAVSPEPCALLFAVGFEQTFFVCSVPTDGEPAETRT